MSESCGCCLGVTCVSVVPLGIDMSRTKRAITRPPGVDINSASCARSPKTQTWRGVGSKAFDSASL
ncbi:hypothetical protein BDV93DRAFT_527333 [Ceratobasidium sp. AG-I]|nr:hypothetical protein BDV93DRAFT_527333 [Ceratobasidium sp. AG-I]